MESSTTRLHPTSVFIMTISSSTDDGIPIECGVCGASELVNPSRPPGDCVCPSCGCFLWVSALVEVTSKLSFVPDLRIPQLTAATRDGAIHEMIEAIANEHAWTDKQCDEFHSAVLQRETMGTTGIGRGFAVPHASLDWITACTSAVAFAPQGLEFKSLDKELVHTVILVASPKSKPGDHLRLLERAARSVLLLGQATA
jgi:nitrogen PTS system EIIA component